MSEKAQVTLQGKAVVARHATGDLVEVFVPLQGRVTQAMVKELLPDVVEILSIKAGKATLEIPMSDVDKYLVK